MYFFAETSKLVAQSTPLGSWNVAGYQQINLHAWVKGAPGTVYMEIYFNQLSAAQEKLTIGPSGPGGWNIAILTRTYPVFAPTLSVVLYNPSTQMEFLMRLYAACCERSKGGLALAGSRLGRLFERRAAPGNGEPHRVLSDDFDIAGLRRAPDQPGSETGEATNSK